MDFLNVARHNFRLKLPHFIATRCCSVTVSGAKSGSDGFQRNFTDSHLETSPFQKTLLGLGSAVVSLADPRRGDMIAALGETTGLKSLEYVKTKMLESEEGTRILSEKPRIASSTIDLPALSALKDGTVGRAYSDFLNKYGYTPDARLAVRFVDDIELAYVIQRYREVHDLFHTILEMPTNMLGEVTVKWVEAVQTRLPMCVGGALFGAARLAPKFSRQYSTMRKTQVELDQSLKERTGKSFKNHPGIMNLKCIAIPDTIQDSINAILQEKNIPDVVKEGQKMYNYLSSRKPPIEPRDFRPKRKEYLKEVKSQMQIKEGSVSEDDAEYISKVVAGQVDVLMRSRMYHWKPLVMNGAMCYHYLVGRAAAEYAVLRRVFNEIHLRDKTFSPKYVFDFGSGVGTVAWVAHELYKNSLKEYFTVDASADMNDLARLIMQKNDPEAEPFVQQLYQRQFLPATSRQYDIVVSAFSLMELDSAKTRLDIISNLWAKTSKYLIIVEHGTNAGFQLVNEARDLVVHLEQQAGGHFHVFAPCAHELPCPRALEATTSKTPCNFVVNHFPLRHLAKGNDSSQERFSFVILKRGERSDDDGQWPRVVRQILPRHKHIVCRLCTASAQLQEVVFTSSKHGKDVYRSVRASSWGDLVPVSLSNAASENKQTDEE